jgi:serine/threonine-protein kinase
MDRTMARPPVQGARILARRYRLLEVLGRSGMSTVYRAHDETLGRTVAVKVLSPALAESDPVWVSRFEREARAAAALTHPAVTTVFDTGAEGDTWFIVMEYVQGRSLERILRDGPLPVAQVVAIGAQLAGALSAAHDAGIVHRDIKPANVMVRPDGSVKVLDFGIARALDEAALTHPASVVGTAGYMAPEQALGRPIDARSDIYSLGCVLYAMLSGRPPFAGEIAAAVLHQQVHAAPAPLGSAVASGAVPAALDALVLQMLAKRPADRPGSAVEVRERLLAVASATGGATAPTRGAGEATAATRVAAPARPVPTRSAPRARPIWLLLLGVALVAIVVVALAAVGGSSSGPSSTHGVTSSTAPPTHTSAAPPTTTTTASGPGATRTPPVIVGVPPGQAKKHKH